jgi:cytosine/adenosine deaminase-related metal-dependent hydrolase
MVRDSASNVSYAPQIELQMGHGWAQAVTALDHGVPIGLSTDVATTAPFDQFTEMRAEVAGIVDRVGSITPGKMADLVIIVEAQAGWLPAKAATA